MPSTNQAHKALTPAQRRERNREEVMRLILEAAREVMREDGVAALNLNEVARRVNMKTPSLYEYFPGKMAVYDALYLQGVQIFLEGIEKIAANKDLAFWDRVEATLQNQLQFAYENPDLYHLVFERPVPGFTPSEKSMAESYRMLKLTDEMLEEYAPGNIHTDLPLDEVRDIFITLMQGLASGQLANAPDLPPGKGRFGRLIPAVRAILEAAWGQLDNRGEIKKLPRKSSKLTKDRKG